MTRPGAMFLRVKEVLDQQNFTPEQYREVNSLALRILNKNRSTLTPREAALQAIDQYRP